MSEQTRQEKKGAPKPAADTALQRAAVTSAAPETVPPIPEEYLQSPGQSIDTTALMQPRFGQEFSSAQALGTKRSSETADYLTEASIQAPDDSTLTSRLISYGILRPSGSSTSFTNILYRHIAGNTELGRNYLAFLREMAYPMNDFTITYNGKGWNASFRDILRYYGVKAPSTPELGGLRMNVEEMDRNNLLIFAIEIPRDPFAGPLIPRTLERLPRGRLLFGAAPQGSLLLAATDAFLLRLHLTPENVRQAQIEPASAADIARWGDPKKEDSAGDPNRFDATIVFWARTYNALFRPIDAHGRPNPLDPDLVKAMIWRESRFDETRSNTSGAMGLTQVMPRERQLVGQVTGGIAGITDENFRDPNIQVASGVRWLFEKYTITHDWKKAVRDYNGGAQKERYMEEVWKAYQSHKRGAVINIEALK